MESNIEILGRIPLHGDQELHVRSRAVEGLEPHLEIAQYNLQDAGYRLICPVPDRPEVIEQLIVVLRAHQEAR